jgi:ABC-type proline/glycine betaine transport system permease subunit
MLRRGAFFSVGVLGFGGLILAGLTRDVRVFVICLPFSLLAVLLWWWLKKNADDARRAHRDKGDDRCN